MGANCCDDCKIAPVCLSQKTEVEQTGFFSNHPELEMLGACQYRDSSEYLEALKEICVGYLQHVAESMGFTLRPSPKQISKMVDTQLSDGRYVCPCKVYVEGVTDGEDIYCPCEEGKEDLRTKGVCHCGMFRRDAK